MEQVMTGKLAHPVHSAILLVCLLYQNAGSAPEECIVPTQMQPLKRALVMLATSAVADQINANLNLVTLAMLAHALAVGIVHKTQPILCYARKVGSQISRT